jgi:hypothetical protein
MMRAGSVVWAMWQVLFQGNEVCCWGNRGVALHEGRTEDFLCGRGRNDLRIGKLNLI